MVSPKRREVISTDVDDVAGAVDHDVAVVSILELQQETEHAVSRHAANEVPPGLQSHQLHV